MMKSTWMRWGVCALAVIAMVALLGGCAKKTEKTEKTESAPATEKTGGTMDMSVAGTYNATMANGTSSLMLNSDMTASLSMKASEAAPAQVENGTWANGASAGQVSVTFAKSPSDSTQSMTLNFMAAGDTLTLTNGDAVGLAGLKLVKQH